MPRVLSRLTLLVMVKAGKALGEHSLQITLERPSGEVVEGPNFSLVFEKANSGQNIASP